MYCLKQKRIKYVLKKNVLEILQLEELMNIFSALTCRAKRIFYDKNGC